DLGRGLEPSADEAGVRERGEYRHGIGGGPAAQLGEGPGGGHRDETSESSRSSSSTAPCQKAWWRAIHRAASRSAPGRRRKRWTRPSIVRSTSPASSSTLRCREIVGCA